MKLRPLGRTGHSIAPLALGGNVFGWTADERTSHSILSAFVDGGFQLIDTADTYSRWAPGHEGGESEGVIGRWLKAEPSRRDRIVLATKVGFEMPGGKGLSERWIRQALKDSLRRLGVDRIDLYQCHIDDADTPLEETHGTLAALQTEGLIGAFGHSQITAPRLERALAAGARAGGPNFATLQPHYNLLERAGFEAPGGLRDVVLAQDLGVINYFGLARGFLTGKYRSEADLGKSVRGGGVKAYLNERGHRVLAALDTVAAEAGASVAQVALAWNIARPGITAPIASATSAAQLTELMGAARLELSPEQIDALVNASGGAVVGG
jgi:aryl-alcohol dehydrogenase-like predicted oxidoreductase